MSKIFSGNAILDVLVWMNNRGYGTCMTNPRLIVLFRQIPMHRNKKKYASLNITRHLILYIDFYIFNIATKVEA